MLTAQLSELVPQLVALASLSPSSHNCQPWRVCLRQTGCDGSPPRLELGLDPKAMLHALPALQREMWVSLGGFSWTLMQLLELHGVRSQLQPLSGESEFSELQIELLDYQPASTSPQLPGFLQQLKNRRTVRGELQSTQPLQAGWLISQARLLTGQSAAWFCCDTAQQQALAELVRQYGMLDFSHQAAWRETYGYIHFSETTMSATTGFHIQQLTGQTGAGQRHLLRWLLHPKMMPVSRLLGIPQQMATALAEHVRQGSLVYLVVEPADTTKTYLQAGAVMMERWLHWTGLGLAMHPVSVLLQHPHCQQQVQQLLNTQGEVVFLGRVGCLSKEHQRYTAQQYRKPLTDFFCKQSM